jgi:site-specific recombinase XerD
VAECGAFREGGSDELGKERRERREPERRARSMRRWDGLVAGHLKQCVARGLKPSTVYGRQLELERFGVWVKRRRPRPVLEDVGTEVIVSYLKSRTAFLCKASVCGVMTKLKGMGEYLVAEGIWLENPLRWMRQPKLDPLRGVGNRISKEDMKKLYKEAASIRDEYQRYLNVAVLSVMAGTGLRRGDLEALNIDDWRHEERLIRLRNEKGGREKLLPVGTRVWECVEGYLPKRHNKLEATGRLTEEALFVTRQGNRLKGERVSKLLLLRPKVNGRKV